MYSNLDHCHIKDIAEEIACLHAKGHLQQLFHHEEAHQQKPNAMNFRHLLCNHGSHAKSKQKQRQNPAKGGEIIQLHYLRDAIPSN